MPRMDGISLTREIRGTDREDLRGVPIILLTGADLEEATRADEAGVSACLGKPVNSAGLVETVSRLLPPEGT